MMRYINRHYLSIYQAVKMWQPCQTRFYLSFIPYRFYKGVQPCPWIDSSGWKLTIKLNSSNIAKINHLKFDVSTSIGGLHQKKLVLSSSGSWHDGKTPCQESGHMHGSVGSCPHHGSWHVLPFPKGRTTGHEPWWGQLPTEPRIRPLSWHAFMACCFSFPERRTTGHEPWWAVSHAYNCFLDTASSCRVKNWKNWVPASSDERLW